MLSRLAQRQPSFIHQHPRPLRPREHGIGPCQGRRQTIELLPNVANGLGAAQRLVVALRADGAVLESDPGVGRRFDAVVAMTHQTFGLANRLEDLVLWTGPEQFCFPSVALRADGGHVRDARRRGAMTAMARVAGWRRRVTALQQRRGVHARRPVGRRSRIPSKRRHARRIPMTASARGRDIE